MSDWPGIEVCPCNMCGKDTHYTSEKLCNDCWEVREGTIEFLKSPTNREWMRARIAESEDGGE